jgi:hypothetical protein
MRLDRLGAISELQGKSTKVVKLQCREPEGSLGRREFAITSTCRRSVEVRARRTRFSRRHDFEFTGGGSRLANYLLRGADREL